MAAVRDCFLGKKLKSDSLNYYLAVIYNHSRNRVIFQSKINLQEKVMVILRVFIFLKSPWLFRQKAIQ